MRRSFLPLLLLCGTWPALMAADTYTFAPSASSGDWQDPANWLVDTGGGGGDMPAATPPTDTDIVTIPTGKTAYIGDPTLPLTAYQLTIDGTLELLGSDFGGGQLSLGSNMTINGELHLGGETTGSSKDQINLLSASCTISGSGSITIAAGGSFNIPIIEIIDSANVHVNGVQIESESLTLLQANMAIPADPLAVPAVVSTMSTFTLGSTARLDIASGASWAVNNGMTLTNSGHLTLAENSLIQFDPSASAGTCYFIQTTGGVLDWTPSSGKIQSAQVSRPNGTLNISTPSTPPSDGQVFSLFTLTNFTSDDFPTASDFATITGNATFTGAQTSTSYDFTVTLLAGSVSIAPLSATPVYGDVTTLPVVTASSTGAVTWTSHTPSVITIVGGQFHVIGRGSAELDVTVAADDTYLESNGSLSIPTVAARAVTVTVGDDTRPYHTANPTPTITATGLASFDAINALGTPVYGYSPTTPTLTTSPGSFSVTVVGLVNSNYVITKNPGTLTITKASQSITFAALTGIAIGDVLHLGAASDSGLAVTYTSSDSTGAVASLSGSTVTGLAAGTLTLTAHQAGNANYLAATDVPQSLTVSKIAQTITFPALSGSLTVGGSAILAATASSSLTVTYASSNTAVATVSGSTVTAVAAGSATITANQVGDAAYAAAPAATITVTVVAPAAPGGGDSGGGGGGCGAGTGISCLFGLGLLLAFRRR